LPQRAHCAFAAPGAASQPRESDPFEKVRVMNDLNQATPALAAVQSEELLEVGGGFGPFFGLVLKVATDRFWNYVSKHL
jgi:hypothetical protein